MAKKIEAFPKTKHDTHRKYNWDEWFDGNIWELEAGTDFKIKVASFRNQVFRNAGMRGLGVKTSVVEKNLVIQAYKKKESE